MQLLGCSRLLVFLGVVLLAYCEENVLFVAVEPLQPQPLVSASTFLVVVEPFDVPVVVVVVEVLYVFVPVLVAVHGHVAAVGDCTSYDFV